MPRELTPCQCPFGLTSFPLQVGTHRLAITGIVPFPRSGGPLERQRAKEYPNLKIANEILPSIRTMLQEAKTRFDEIEAFVASQQAMALHEIRKLNRTIKQNAERFCKDESPTDPDLAHSEIVAIWKAAELMSNQFDVLELLANEDLATLPTKSLSEPYRVFDKLIRIFRHAGADRQIDLKAPYGYYPQVRVCDKTFPILASVLLENAIKYSADSSAIEVTLNPVASAGVKVRIQIANLAIDARDLNQRIFEKGFRVANDKDGTGKGLYLAQLVAKQHGSILKFAKEPVNTGNGQVRCCFWLDIDEYRG
jgi:signal transduction histidine kinase